MDIKKTYLKKSRETNISGNVDRLNNTATFVFKNYYVIFG